SRRETAEQYVCELPGGAAEGAWLGATERPRERDSVERAEDGTRRDVRRDVDAKGARGLAFGDDRRDRVEVRGEMRSGELLHEARRLPEDDGDDLGEIAFAFEETELHVDDRAQARRRVGLFRQLLTHVREQLVDAVFEE